MDEVRKASPWTRIAWRYKWSPYREFIKKFPWMKTSLRRIYTICTNAAGKNRWRWLNETFGCYYRVKPQRVTDKNYLPAVNISGCIPLLNIPDSSPQGLSILYTVQDTATPQLFRSPNWFNSTSTPRRKQINCPKNAVLIWLWPCKRGWTEITLARRESAECEFI